MSRIREDVAVESRGRMTYAERAALHVFGLHGSPSAEGAAAEVWAAHSLRIVRNFTEHPSRDTARAVANFSDDKRLAAFAAEWLVWDSERPEPRAILSDDADTATAALAANEAHRRAEPTPKRRSRAR